MQIEKCREAEFNVGNRIHNPNPGNHKTKHPKLYDVQVFDCVCTFQQSTHVWLQFSCSMLYMCVHIIGSAASGRQITLCYVEK
jgi:hypothetical protein